MQIRDPQAAALVNSVLRAYAESSGPPPDLHGGRPVQPQEPLVLPTGDGTARQIVAPPPRPMTANQRIDQGFEDAGAGPVGAVGPGQRPGPRMIGPDPSAPPVPSAAPAPAPQLPMNLLPPGAVPGAPPRQQNAGPLSRMLGLPPEISSRIQDAMAGIAGADPRQPPLQAAASGFVGARSARDEREQRKRDEMMRDEKARLEADERAREQRMEDARFAMEREEHGWEREGRDLKRVKSIADIERTLADTKKAQKEANATGLTVQQVLDINKLAIDAYKQSLPEYPMEEDYKAAAVAAGMFKEQITREARAAAGLPAETGDRQTKHSRARSLEQIPGEGTYESPKQVRDVNEALALPAGAHFLDENGEVRIR